jgi:hypothetical protein
MEQAATQTSGIASFASFLASVAAPPAPAATAWNDDELADDIATLSYEQVLKTHARCRPPASDTEAKPDAGLKPSGDPHQVGFPSTCRDTPAPLDRTLKRASITIRLTEPECAQMRSRAAEAGLTVSAYLRSCALEVETLRTQVKETLAQLRESAAAPMPPLPSRPKPWFHLWSRRAVAADRR